MDKKATRDGFGDGLMDVADDKRVVVMSADLTESTKANIFENAHPDRFFQCGVAEQNMVGMAVGMALSGKIPFVTTFGAFIPFRALDQIRVSTCYNNVNVKFGSTHTGLTVGEDGATHQALEDIASMRALPNMIVVVPCDYWEARKAVKHAAMIDGPVYLRLGRSKLPLLTAKSTPFHIGKAEVFRKGSDITIVACGTMVAEALLAADKLLNEDIHAEVINCHTIKPLDSEKILKSAKKTGCIVSAEEHQKHGGLGSAIAEEVVKHHLVPMEFVAVNDTFGESGKPEELFVKYNLTYWDIVHAAKKVIRRKKLYKHL